MTCVFSVWATGSFESFILALLKCCCHVSKSKIACWGEVIWRRIEVSSQKLTYCESDYLTPSGPYLIAALLVSPGKITIRTFQVSSFQLLTHRIMRKINDYCFKPLYFGVVCCSVKVNLYSHPNVALCCHFLMLPNRCHY